MSIEESCISNTQLNEQRRCGLLARPCLFSVLLLAGFAERVGGVGAG